MKSAITRAVLALLLMMFAASATAADTDVFSDPAMEARARALQKELRCMVCQGESLDESNAPLAADLRRIIRDRIAAGETDDQIKAFLVARYGDFILLNPPLRSDTFLLWFGPVLLLLLGGVAVGVVVLRSRRRARQNPDINQP
jgi:cytochrome c-type biogenesis protein CcmH